MQDTINLPIRETGTHGDQYEAVQGMPSLGGGVIWDWAAREYVRDLQGRTLRFATVEEASERARAMSEPPAPPAWAQRQSILAGVDLRRFNLRVDQVAQLDDHGLPCDLFEHEADADGNYPTVAAQAYFTGRRLGLSCTASGCLACVARLVGRDADGDRLTVIELEHLP